MKLYCCQQVDAVAAFSKLIECDLVLHISGEEVLQGASTTSEVIVMLIGDSSVSDTDDHGHDGFGAELGEAELFVSFNERINGQLNILNILTEKIRGELGSLGERDILGTRKFNDMETASVLRVNKMLGHLITDVISREHVLGLIDLIREREDALRERRDSVMQVGEEVTSTDKDDAKIGSSERLKHNFEAVKLFDSSRPLGLMSTDGREENGFLDARV